MSAQSSSQKKHTHKKKNSPTLLAPELVQLRKNIVEKLAQVSISDERAFRRRLAGAHSAKAFSAINQDVKSAIQQQIELKDSIPKPNYPIQLPVSARKDDIKTAIANNQVVIIAGETGSGKTTQIPKICLELGLGVRGLIGHTQPRRLAARTVAERIAEELGQKIGESVGYAIRFDDRVGQKTAIKLMTDGILLAEMQRDRFLNAYDTIIIDEAHERSLNIDFLLGCLKQLLPKRPDLKVIITSATIDPERFSRHFNDAPIIEVSGRTYPVEIRYRPNEVGNPTDGLIDALIELMGEGEGDILCFFAGEADIRDAMELIATQQWKNIEVTPLYGRLSNEEQHRVFRPHTKRRIVLATNIAETSLTVPGIHYVIDTGTARISRYSVRTKVQRLPIEDISQASANQRSGRCGRVADGIAIRLYSEEDFLSRPEFTDPEILRTNLASVILQMASLKLGDIDAFPFIEKPDTRSIRDGLMLLHELGALKQKEDPHGQPQLTHIGRTLARIPLDPRMARMLIEAERLGCLEATMIIVAALTIQDIRERPLEHQAHADQLHARFKDNTSDFLSYLKLWEYVSELRAQLSGNQFRRQVQKEYLHHMRIREWWDLVRQLRSIGEQIGWTTVEKTFSSSQPDLIHQSLLTGLLSHIGVRSAEGREFHGSRNTKFMIFPGSSLAKKPPEYIMAAELVETTRLWARDVATIDPRWIENIAGDLLRHQYSEPVWSSKKATALVHQKSTLYGVTVINDRLVAYSRIDTAAARDMFIRNALIEGQWTTQHKFFARNVEKLADAANIEAKARRRDLIVDEERLFTFYDQRIPAHITNAHSFDRWWRKTESNSPALLDFDPEQLLSKEAEVVTNDQFPDIWHQDNLEFQLSYQFEPGTIDDGVSIHIPIPLLAGLRNEGFEWLVPGMRIELVTALIKSLPKHLRRQVVPAPNYAQLVIDSLDPNAGELTVQLADQLRQLGGRGINANDFDFAQVPDHLRMRFAAVDRRGTIIDASRNLDELKHRRQHQIKASVSRVSRIAEQEEVAEWTNQTLGVIKEEIISTVDGQKVTAYPTLVATKNGVAVKVVGTRQEADASMLTATLTLLLREIPVNAQKMVNGLAIKQRVGVENFPHGGVTGLVDDARVAATRDLLLSHGGVVRDPEKFAQLLAAIKPQVPGLVRQTIVAIAPALIAYYAVDSELKKWSGPAIDDLKNQLKFLLPKNAIAIHGMEHLKHLPRYLQAMQLRLADMEHFPDRDADRQYVVNSLESQLKKRLAELPNSQAPVKKVREIQWMLQELRVSLFAQRLGTAQSVSERKISKAINNLSAS
ncbi:HrpA-like helicase [Corynebacterium kutscheri]|uniref:RNA helicase HrpA n=1 Tax=Corynebacterium kutscheri TaxID=35755 RepID=A0A0F6TDP0_9CORY|nr:ATP-dependent RNA helicase HrpA [Corynebacterium kutscheri]AKE41389.1 RNA helicase HrpA [Corynebacterium kutscheri]VEH09713.1 HrpA-like helicase [Corynebacterium kutscheri]VEH79795.1 HrpA-like helicase [Corynebacterium kutscheri]